MRGVKKKNMKKKMKKKNEMKGGDLPKISYRFFKGATHIQKKRQ